ncbi:hypothetical protein THAOC_32756 [Thalassiosira oceanica]|uniref:Uncharacterized protein n=1 Tax=Thalassiosira oceanica TaxID=159749 RepID=K0R6G8_THAOC|nr:hypothetical protein THAOC_32756 [Thalassiosira oceanica]|eukprot:EJK48445.1 hypothetical protein THAOC_32756 [Thalassiosira oceanica]
MPKARKRGGRPAAGGGGRILSPGGQHLPSRMVKSPPSVGAGDKRVDGGRVEKWAVKSSTEREGGGRWHSWAAGGDRPRADAVHVRSGRQRRSWSRGQDPGPAQEEEPVSHKAGVNGASAEYGILRATIRMLRGGNEEHHRSWAACETKAEVQRSPQGAEEEGTHGVALRQELNGCKGESSHAAHSIERVIQIEIEWHSISAASNSLTAFQ